MGCFPPICQFSTKPETEIAQKPEAIVLEGKYWKWNSQSVITEYRKWRLFHKERIKRRRFVSSFFSFFPDYRLFFRLTFDNIYVHCLSLFIADHD